MNKILTSLAFVVTFLLLMVAAPNRLLAQHGCGHMGSGGSHASHNSEDDKTVGEGHKATIVDGVQVVKIVVNDDGYSPARILLKRDIPVRLLFEQRSANACVSQVQIPSLNIPKTTLREGVETAIEFVPNKSGTVQFSCGMRMVKGTLVIE